MRLVVDRKSERIEKIKGRENEKRFVFLYYIKIHEYGGTE